MIDFFPINLDRQDLYNDYFDRCPERPSDYSFINLWAWAEAYRLSWAFGESLVWIKQARPDACFWAPIGDWHRVDWDAELRYLGGNAIKFERIPDKLLNHWQARFETSIKFKETRGHWDYLYRAQDLIELKGKRYHKKKNLVNQFIKNYPFEYLSFGSSLIELAQTMQKDWCTWRDCESSDMLSDENHAIDRVLGNWRQLAGLNGGALIVDERIVAYTLAEIRADGSIIIHFEKGDPNYKGAYQMINQKFLEMNGQRALTVNREQDLDIEGLRKGKLSYHPVAFIKKSDVRIDLR